MADEKYFDRGERLQAVNSTAAVLKHWREDGRLYTTPPSSKDVEIAQRIVRMVEKILLKRETEEKEER